MIEFDQIDDSFYHFPFRPRPGDTSSDTATPCIGGVDLVSNPEKVELIPEAAHSPMLKKLLTDLNTPNSKLLTLGCAYWAHKDNRDTSYAYLEFSFREHSVATNLEFIRSIDEQFEQFLQENKKQLSIEFSVPEQAFDIVSQALFWSIRPFSYFGSEERILIYFQAGSPRHQDLEIFLDLLHRFLTEYLVVPS